MMFSDVPNLAASFGYTNASWTLKCDDSVLPEPWIDFSSGYVQRSLDKLPKQGSKLPWKLHQNYSLDIVMLRYGAIADGVMEFSRG
jgi:monooxygenase